MHRHGYQGRKLSRERDQRKALMVGLASSLVEHGQIETTLPKAKELRRYIEKVITKAKQGNLAGRRQVIASLNTQMTAYRLVDDIAPLLKDRNGGYVRIQRTRLRVGDGAQMATISFVDDLSSLGTVAGSTKVMPQPEQAPEVKKEKSAQPKVASTKTVKATSKNLSQKPTVINKRSGER